MTRLENWGLVAAANPYLPPELWGPPCLVGTVTGHPRLPDGSFIASSSIRNVREEDDVVVVTTRSGTEYHLGKVNDDYEEMFPDAQRRLVEQFKPKGYVLSDEKPLVQ